MTTCATEDAGPSSSVTAEMDRARVEMPQRQSSELVARPRPCQSRGGIQSEDLSLTSTTLEALYTTQNSHSLGC